MTFQLDTSGTVHFGAPYAKKHGLLAFYRWDDLDPFAQGYVEALFAAVAEDTNKEWGHCTLLLRFSDLAPETLARIIADCAGINTVRMRARMGFKPGADGGRAFYETRQSGKWAAFPPLTVRLGDDGKVYFQ